MSDAWILIQLAALVAYDTIAVGILIWGAYVVIKTWKERR